jgi:hypothetical protein
MTEIAETCQVLIPKRELLRRVPDDFGGLGALCPSVGLGRSVGPSAVGATAGRQWAAADEVDCNLVWFWLAQVRIAKAKNSPNLKLQVTMQLTPRLTKNNADEI